MKCPNCNGEIGRFELAPDCKHCGANIFYSQQEKLLAQDAKKCELEFASFRILKTKIKFAFISGPIQIMRIIAMIIAIGVIFIPFVTMNVTLPMISSQISLGAFGVYQAFSGGELTLMLDLKDYLPELFTAFAALCIMFVLIFLMGLGVFAALLLSFLNLNKSAKACCAFSAAGFAFSVTAAVISFILPNAAQDTFINVSMGTGAFACIAVFILIFALNLITLKKNFKPDIKQVDLDRVAILKRVRAGEISLDDLPLPVLESDEEQAERLNAQTEEDKQNG